MATEMGIPTFRPGAAVIPSTQVELSISCRNLLDKDLLSKSDPICVLYFSDPILHTVTEFGRTEKIMNSLNPDFVHKFLINYFFEQSQNLIFEIYDVDSPSQRLDKQDFLGKLSCTLGEIIGSPASKLTKELTIDNRNAGLIIVHAEEVVACKENVILHLRGVKLDKKDFFGKSDPFLIFYRCNEDNSFTIVHKTEVIKNTLNPTWTPFSLPVRALCNADYDRTIKIECFDWDSDGGSHDLIGELVTNLRTLTKGPGPTNEYDCINQKKKAKKKGYKNSGTIQLLACRIEVIPTFLDYVSGGTQIHFTVAVDFTASNGNPTDPSSLHFTSPYQPSQYAVAIRAIGDIIQDYDTDKQFPALGFGARLPPDGRVSHEFFLNFNPTSPYCQGVEGILQAYHQTISSVQLYGPTNFSPVINHVARFADSIRDGSAYFILLIITDGIITDMPQTKEAIVQAASLPLSIIIVGVGLADFSAMEELDGDNVRISSGGRYAERDIVQFVPLREYITNNYQMSQARLAKEVLAEVPDQVLSYMKKYNIMPKPQASVPTI